MGIRDDHHPDRWDQFVSMFDHPQGGPVTDPDLELHAWPPRATGGQQVADHRTGVLVVHRPTGIAVIVDSERSRMTNGAEAVKRLRAVLALLDPGDPEWAE